MTAAAARARAAAVFGSDPGAGLAMPLWRDAVCSGRFAPERLGASPRTAARWRRSFAVDVPQLAGRERESTAHGDVEKLQLRLHDGLLVEAVHLPMGRGRSALCVSTQAGCARGCAFCATARLGLRRNLTAAEITGQVVRSRLLGHRPRTIVFQGMGEPLDNLKQLLQAIAVLTDGSGLAFAHAHLTVCTAGHAPGIRALARAANPRLGLSLSLNAADDRLRRELMPIGAQHPLREVHEALVAYRRWRNLALGIHWCLLPGINDREADANAIAAFCRGLGRVLVHVIPFNPGPDPLTRAPTAGEVDRFVGWLRNAGLPVRRRIVKGRSLQAACGQLAGAIGGDEPLPAAK